MRARGPTAERTLSGLVVGALFGAVGGLAYALPANLATLTESTDELLLVVALAINAAGWAPRRTRGRSAACWP
jgi:hypothetical protein